MPDYPKLLDALNKSFRESSEDFYHSAPLVEYGVGGKRATFDLRDVLLIGAISGSNMLISSRTGGGKTTIAKKLMRALFDDNYAFLQVDSKLDENRLRDVAFGKIKEGRDLSEAVKETKFLTAPGVVVDEFNRAPPVVTNQLQNYLTNGTLVFEGGREVETGVPTHEDGSRYQIKVGTINEGSGYYGTQQVDKASRDRFALEINLDIFEPTIEDKRKLILKGAAGPGKKKSNGTDNLETVLALYDEVKRVPVGIAQEFILYFMRMNQCIKSPEGTKLTIENFSHEYCKGCTSIARDKDACGNVYAPSERAVANWVGLSKAFALYRSYKTGEKNVEVGLGDVRAAAPFVLHSKLGINPNWTAKRARRSSWNAVNEAVSIAYDRWLGGLKENKELIDRAISGKPETDDMGKMMSYCEKDPWFFDKDVVKAVYESRKTATAAP